MVSSIAAVNLKIPLQTIKLLVKCGLFFKISEINPQWFLFIKFNDDKPYTVEDNGNREVKYADKKDIIDGIVQKYHPDWLQKQDTNDSESGGTKSQKENYVREHSPANKKKNGGQINSTPPSRRIEGIKPSPNEVN